MTTTSGPAAAPGSQSTRYRLLYVSVSGHRCLVGGPTIDENGEVPADVGTTFHSVDEIERYVCDEFQGLTSFWQVQVIDDDGTAVRYGFRGGYRGTGECWVWRSTSS